MEPDAFLARVRAAQAGVQVPPLPETLPRTPASGDGRAFERFAEELAKVGGEARRVRPADLVGAVSRVADGVRSAVVAAGVGEYRAAIEVGLEAAGCRVREPTREAAEQAELGITGAVLGVASTGSVLLPMGPEAPRVASLLPWHHLVVLPEERLVPGFEELFAALPQHAASAAQTVLITGPSRTADIELSIVRGVHGPEELTVLVVTS